MKKALLILAFLSLIAFCGNAQDHSDYLNKAMEQVEEGNCDAAQQFYDVYKELTGKTSSWLEKAIRGCKEKTEPKTYNLGDDAENFVGERGYKIAYLDASGKHGFAVKNDGYSKTGWENSPSRAECKIMYRNRVILGLSGECWTNEKTRWYRYYTFDFSTGQERTREYGKNGHSAKVIRVKRF